METVIASGPVIIENGKVVLVKEEKPWGTTPWIFPGGHMEPSDNNDPETNCRREVKEELGIEIKILKQLITCEGKSWTDPLNKKYLMYHFLAERIGEIKTGDGIVEYAWLDINNLPADCAQNVYEVIENYKNMI